jgi:hypothetical protein
MSEEKKDEKVDVVASYFTPDEWAVMFNGIGEIPLKLNSKEIEFFSKLRAKIQPLHTRSQQLIQDADPKE